MASSKAIRRGALALAVFFYLLSDCRPVHGASNATSTSELFAGFVVKLNITDAGSGYIEAPAVTISGGGGFGARAIAEISNGSVVNLVITSAGIGYTSPPQVIIAPPPGGFPIVLKLVPSHVLLNLKAVLGHKYQIEASNDQITWWAVGLPVTPLKEQITVEAAVYQLGKYLRARRLD